MNHNSIAAYHDAEHCIMSKGELVLSTLTLKGPMTYEELCDSTGILVQSISGVIGKLRERGLVMNIRNKHTRTGSLAVVWDHTEPYLRKVNA